jgi:hypothetical protein
MGNLEAEKYEGQGEVLSLLLDIQRKSAPIELSIGWVNVSGTVQQGINKISATVSCAEISGSWVLPGYYAAGREGL